MQNADYVFVIFTFMLKLLRSHFKTEKHNKKRRTMTRINAMLREMSGYNT